MSAQEEMHVTAIGHIAHQVLRRSPFALVSGTSSRGIYLQPLGDLTLFLTPEKYRGPLTINVRKNWDYVLSYQPGTIVSLGDDEIVFSDPDFTIQIESPLIWRPSHPPTNKVQEIDRYTELINRAQDISPDFPFPNPLEIITGNPIFKEKFSDLAIRMVCLSAALKRWDPLKISSEMKLLLGHGPGLTPMGDDIVVGIILAIVRMQRQFTRSDDLIQNFHTVISSAEEKTTTVSWSIISCAVQGSADERIFRVLDGLIAGREIPDHDLENLLSWGSSSGMAVLAGILMVLDN
jgi:hypothetical protein